MRQLKIISFILFVVFSSSCNKEPEDPTVEGDAVVISKRSGTNVVYGVAFYANSSSSLKTVSVVSSANPSGTISLSAVGDNTYSFRKEPSESEFSATKPTAATYTFNAVFNGGGTSESQDVLTTDALAPVAFEKCLYNTTNLYAELKWTALTNANSYVVQLLNASGTVIFNTGEVSNTTTGGTLSSSAVGWSSGYPQNGDVYTVRIYALEYEDATGASYQMQATSISDSTITWGV